MEHYTEAIFFSCNIKNEIEFYPLLFVNGDYDIIDKTLSSLYRNFFPYTQASRSILDKDAFLIRIKVESCHSRYIVTLYLKNTLFHCSGDIYITTTHQNSKNSEDSIRRYFNRYLSSNGYDVNGE